VDLTQSSIFDVVRRGYDRQQVDDHIRTLAAQLNELQQAHRPLVNQVAELQQKQQPLVAQVSELQAAHQREHRRAEWAESELRSVRAQLEQIGDQPTGQQGFGYRVERLLRTAEQEAGEVRSSAAREATQLLERARKDAEAHRHEVEQSLIHRTATLDQEAAQRKVELDERDRQIGEQAETAREEAERMLSEVRRQADQLHHEAAVRAEQERIKAEKSIRERQEGAEQELGRLRSLHDEVRGQLGRLLESLANEFGVGAEHFTHARSSLHQSTTEQNANAHTLSQNAISQKRQSQGQHAQITSGTTPSSSASASSAQSRTPRPYPARQPMAPRADTDSVLPEQLDGRTEARTNN
jgi:chromosome segregation ATPase